METKHTPGPWKARYLPQHRIRVTTDLGSPSLGDDSICDIALWMVDYAEQHANARLIAAAPDMLEACTVALGHLTGGMDGDWRDCDPRALLRAAIAKAKGED